MEARGALVFLIEGNFVRVNLDPMTDLGDMMPEVLAQAVLALRDDIREILIARRTAH